MMVGILKEIKADENRVAITPAGVEVMTKGGHTVLVEKDAGTVSGFEDAQFADAGAEVVAVAKDIFSRSDMILRVKEPQHNEYVYLKPGQIYFSYLHLASSPEVAQTLLKAGSVAIAYETIQEDDGSLPLLKPMGEVAGPMAIQEGAKYLEMAQNGHGVLLGGVPGVDPATVVIIGGGTVGTHAAKVACRLGAKVQLLDVNLERLRYLSDIMPENCSVRMASPATIRDLVSEADLVVGAALVPGARTPIMVTRDMLASMKTGAVLVDVAIDQGGCFESSRETTHSEPTYVLEGVVHYAVSNMPGAVPRTSSIALTNATLPFALEIADKGWRQAMRDNPKIRRGANIVDGKVTHQEVADALGVDCAPLDALI